MTRSSPIRLTSLGGGNMAQALLAGLLRAPAPVSELVVIEPLAATRGIIERSIGAQALAAGVALHCFSAVEEAIHIPPSDWLLLAVKPQQARAALTDLSLSAKGWLQQPALLSIAAGLPMSVLADWVGHHRLVRGMPNTPALVGQGISGAVADPSLPAAEREQAHQLLQAVGPVLWVDDEALLDAVTALSGSGPAYVFRFIEGLTHAGVQLGLSLEQSQQLAKATVSGAMALLQASPEGPAALREKVTSKGGTTEAALKALEQGGFVPLLEAALKAAADRAAALGDERRRESQ
ncbi:MAG: pyrroline-5-carboxylate reductase [Burkholderiaceae bacterium]